MSSDGDCRFFRRMRMHMQSSSANAARTMRDTTTKTTNTEVITAFVKKYSQLRNIEFALSDHTLQRATTIQLPYISMKEKKANLLTQRRSPQITCGYAMTRPP